MNITLSAQRLFAIYIAAISVISIIAAVSDKRKAIRGKFRVPEKTLILLAALGGSAAMFVAMRLIRHKTSRPKFMIGIPIIFILQLLALFFIIYFF